MLDFSKLESLSMVRWPCEVQVIYMLHKQQENIGNNVTEPI